jgi:branched-chain amino acid transport system substrate-binding protein
MERNMRWKALALATLTACAAPAAHAQITDGVIKIAVLNDQSGLYADIGGPGSVWAAKKAVEDYCKANKCEKIEVVFADHQNKPDIGSNIVRQ